MSGYKPLRAGIPTNEKGASGGVASLNGASRVEQSPVGAAGIAGRRGWWVPLFQTLGANGNLTGAGVAVDKLLQLQPFLVQQPALKVQALAVNITTVGEDGGLIHLGIYRFDDQDIHTLNSPEFHRVADFGTVPADALGVAAASHNVTLTAGWHAVGVLVDVDTTPPQGSRTALPATGWSYVTNVGDTVRRNGLITTSSYTELPAIQAGSLNGNGNIPAVWMRLGTA